MRANGIGQRWLERAIAVAFQNRYLAVEYIRQCDIDDAFAVEVSDGDSLWIVSRRIVHRCGKRAVSMPEQNRYVEGIDYRQIEAAVTIEVTNRDRGGSITRGKTGARSKRSVTISEQDRQVVVVCINHDQIRLAVTVEIGDSNRQRVRTRLVHAR